MGSARLNLALIGFLGCVVVYALRTDVSFAIVCMVNSTAVDILAGTGGANVTKKAATCSSQGGSVSIEKDTACFPFLFHFEIFLILKFHKQYVRFVSKNDLPKVTFTI